MLRKFIYWQRFFRIKNDLGWLLKHKERQSLSCLIVEGTSRTSNKEKERFIEVAYGSLLESYCQLQIAVDLNYITAEQLDEIQLQINKIANKLSALKRSYANTQR